MAKYRHVVEFEAQDKDWSEGESIKDHLYDHTPQECDYLTVTRETFERVPEPDTDPTTGIKHYPGMEG